MRSSRQGYHNLLRLTAGIRENAPPLVCELVLFLVERLPTVKTPVIQECV